MYLNLRFHWCDSHPDVVMVTHPNVVITGLHKSSHKLRVAEDIKIDSNLSPLSICNIRQKQNGEHYDDASCFSIIKKQLHVTRLVKVKRRHVNATMSV